MNKQQLASLISEQNGISQAQAILAIDQVTNAIGFALAGGESVKLVGFGTFKQKRKEAGQARNPKTGEVISTEAKNLVSFHASEVFKQTINP